jgi:hypothetical protein
MSSRAFRTYAGVPVIPFKMLSTAGRTRVTGALAGRDRDGGTDAALARSNKCCRSASSNCNARANASSTESETPDRLPRSRRA